MKTFHRVKIPGYIGEVRDSEHPDDLHLVAYGRSALVVAMSLGWSHYRVQKCCRCHHVGVYDPRTPAFRCSRCSSLNAFCEHASPLLTCTGDESCGLTPADFAPFAEAWLLTLTRKEPHAI